MCTFSTFGSVNFLAHLYLSGEDEALRFGNFIADAVRGKNFSEYTLGVQNGIQLHRAIDTFTDQHPIFRAHCKLLFPDHGHYARVIMDVVYDYFLASNWEKYHTTPLPTFVESFYQTTLANQKDIPDKMQRLFQLMKKQNWLLQYRDIAGLENILFHMSKRTAFPSKFDSAVPTIQSNEMQMLPAFFDFFEDVQSFCKNHAYLDQ